MKKKLPSLVIVGRPNVGKSTLFNRLTGTRRAIVTDEPGITRDRIYGKAEWEGRTIEVVDTGGIVPDDKALIPTEILRQARVAFEKASLLVLVVDSTDGLTPLDQELALLLRTTGKPFVVAVNKIDSQLQQANAVPFHKLGVPVFPIAAEHGTGVDDLLDEVLKQFYGATPQASAQTDFESDDDAPSTGPKTIEIAIIGRPNVGKSTLLNRLAGEERSIVSPIPGTTMDNVDTEVVHNGRTYRFVDTAGIRRKGKTNSVAEKLSVVMAKRGLERADVALLIVDGEQGVTGGDATIASYAEQSGRSVIIVVNKWDLAVEAAQDLSSEKKKRGGKFVAFNANKLVQDYEPLVRARLKFLSYAPVVFLSAKTGENIDRLYNLIDKVVAARNKRISTGELNRWVAKVDLTRGTSPASREVKIFYITQASTAPPTFVLFTNQLKPLHFSYQRFLENELRKEFGFLGTPIRFTQRLKKRGTRHRERKDPRKP